MYVFRQFSLPVNVNGLVTDTESTLSTITELVTSLQCIASTCSDTVDTTVGDLDGPGVHVCESSRGMRFLASQLTHPGHTCRTASKQALNNNAPSSLFVFCSSDVGLVRFSRNTFVYCAQYVTGALISYTVF